jgi:hypothetical protein
LEGTAVDLLGEFDDGLTEGNDKLLLLLNGLVNKQFGGPIGTQTKDLSQENALLQHILCDKHEL